ncbi:aspartate carbamoyltransferase [Candidatus Peregrinibacteria bacterium]|nr:aspartate carbamoyltransferase [Candidatus Peregrinibacteria bacterium]
MSLITTKNLSKKQLDAIMNKAQEMEPYAQKKQAGTMMKGRILATLFYEPSTRTRLSFETAMLRMGGSVISVADADSSSLAKGETIADTARVVSRYADIIAIRHPKEGSAREAADYADVPIINAGDGAGDHPTQGLLDVYTIQKEKGTMEGLNIVLSGDLTHSRTAGSLAYLLAHYGVNLTFLAPESMRMKEEVTTFLREKGVSYTETDDTDTALRNADVLYATRVQRERFSNQKEYDRLKDRFVFNKALIEKHNASMLILHPLPRVYELSTDLDEVPGAAYFRQVSNGVSIRMALISLLLSSSL